MIPKHIKHFYAGVGLWVQVFFQQKPWTKLWVKSYLVTGQVRSVLGIMCLLSLEEQQIYQAKKVWKEILSTVYKWKRVLFAFLRMACGPLRNGPAKLQSVSPEAGDPWSMNAAHGVGRQARKHSCRKVLPRLGRLDTGVKQRTAMPGFPQFNCDLSFFPPTWTNLSILYYSSEAASALGKKHSCPCFCFLCILWGMGEMWIFLEATTQEAKRRGETLAYEFMWPMGQIDVMLQMWEFLCGINA